MNAYERLTYNPDAPLKAGDKVVRIGYDGAPNTLLTVAKVTPTGIIKTVEGECFKPDWNALSLKSEYFGLTPYVEKHTERTINTRKYPVFSADNAPKAGDKVILIGGWQTPERVLTVKKITPTGLVKTEEGLVYKPIDDGRYVQKGSGWIYTERFAFTEIVPYTDALAEQVREYQRKRDEEAARRRTIDEAKGACCVMAGVENTLPYEVAVKILEVYTAYKETRT